MSEDLVVIERVFVDTDPSVIEFYDYIFGLLNQREDVSIAEIWERLPLGAVDEELKDEILKREKFDVKPDATFVVPPDDVVVDDVTVPFLDANLGPIDIEFSSKISGSIHVHHLLLSFDVHFDTPIPTIMPFFSSAQLPEEYQRPVQQFLTRILAMRYEWRYYFKSKNADSAEVCLVIKIQPKDGGGPSKNESLEPLPKLKFKQQKLMRRLACCCGNDDGPATIGTPRTEGCISIHVRYLAEPEEWFDLEELVSAIQVWYRDFKIVVLSEETLDNDDLSDLTINVSGTGPSAEERQLWDLGDEIAGRNEIPVFVIATASYGTDTDRTVPVGRAWWNPTSVIWVNAEQVSEFGGESPNDLMNVTWAHEIGHVLGLAHHDVHENIMNASVGGGENEFDADQYRDIGLSSYVRDCED